MCQNFVFLVLQVKTFQFLWEKIVNILVFKSIFCSRNCPTDESVVYELLIGYNCSYLDSDDVFTDVEKSGRPLARFDAVRHQHQRHGLQSPVVRTRSLGI